MPPGRRSAALVTVLFTDIVGSTEIAAEMGDRGWRELLTQHHRIVRAALRRHGGREVDTAGDGFLSAFGEPEAALRCAWEIVREVQTLGIDVRAGVHVGQDERIDGKVGGLVVHAGARIAALAGPAEVLASRTLTELVPGSGFRFEDRGMHTLKGVPGEHQILAVSGLKGQDLPRPLGADEAAARRANITPPIVPRRTGLMLTGVGVLLAIVLVWVLLPDTEPESRQQGFPPSTLVRIDPSTNRIVETIRRAPPLGGQTGRTGIIEPEIAAGGGAVWVSYRGTLTHVDPPTKEITRVITSRGVLDIVVGHNALWASPFRADLMMRIDPASLQETHTTDLGEGEAPLSATGFQHPIGTSIDAVWVGASDSLVQLDPVDGRVVERFQLDQAIDGLVGTSRDVWVVDRLARTLARFNTEELRIVETIELQTGPDAFAVSEGSDVWVVNMEAGTITPVEGGVPREPIQVGSHPVDIAVGGDAVWVADDEDGTVTRIDPSLGRVEEVIDIGADVSAVAVDPSSGAVWAYVI